MFKDLFESIRDSFRYRFGRRAGAEHTATDEETREALRHHNDAEARVAGRTMGEPDGIRAYGKGSPR